jgi:hypothetical protein
LAAAGRDRKRDREADASPTVCQSMHR